MKFTVCWALVRSYYLAILLFLITHNGFSQNTQILDEEKVPPYSLPDPLVFQDGSKVKTPKQWHKKRRAEILDMAEREMYGRSPDRPKNMTFKVFDTDKNALAGKATRKQVTVYFNGQPDGLQMDILLYTPNHVKQAPAFLGLNFWGNHTIHPDPGIKLSTAWVENYRLPWANLSCVQNNRATEACRGVNASQWPLDSIISRGYALVTVYREEIASDNGKDSFKKGVHLLHPELQERDDNFGTIAAWAWGLSRVMDYLEKDKAIDAKRVALFGWSRLGKAALWAGARDQRFAMVISNESGAGGAALTKRKYGEDAERLNRVFPHWFNKSFRRYSNNEAALPFDQHHIISLIAPRPVYIASAVEDKGSDPYGEFLAAKAANPVYKFLRTEGLPTPDFPALHQPIMGQLGYHIRAGNHDVTLYDWEQFLKFADKFLQKK